MIDPIRQVMARIYNTIPKPILEATFNPFQEDISLDEHIKEKVILARVRDDLSVRAGKIRDIILNLDWAKYTSSPSPYALGISGSYSTFVIPPEEREHRDISCVLSVRFPYSINTSLSGSCYNSCTIKGNTLSQLACAALNSQTGAGMLSSPMGTIHPGNVVVLTPQMSNFVPWQVKVRLRFDDNFTGMSVSEIQPFCLLCEQAVKAYIYTHLIFDIETNLVSRGMDLGVIKDIVSNYADANDKYDEYLLAAGASNIFDEKRLYGILTRMVPNR